MLGLLRRTFARANCTTTKRALYQSMVKSKLTYCSPIWRPHLLKDIKAIETIQRRATKYILNDYCSCYKTRLISLHLLPLMVQFEINDILLFITCIKNPTASFDNISRFVSFSSCTTIGLLLISSLFIICLHQVMLDIFTLTVCHVFGIHFRLYHLHKVSIPSSKSSKDFSGNISWKHLIPIIHVLSISCVLAINVLLYLWCIILTIYSSVMVFCILCTVCFVVCMSGC